MAKNTWYAGIDVGGTKILAVVASPGGIIRGRARRDTPRGTDGADVVRAIAETLKEALSEAAVASRDLAGIGLAVPAAVDYETGTVMFSPNTSLQGMKVVAALRKHFRVPIALGNDVDMGTLGEKWLGAARDVDNVVGLFVGTGIGGGVILDGKLLRSHRGSAGEIGHMIMQIGGPRCGCGEKGCLEALASRTAIERDIRSQLARGGKSVIRAMVAGKEGPIRSKVLRKALAAGDKVAVRVIGRACEVIAEACLNIRHILDPQMIVLGGGVLEACETFMMPRIEKRVTRDTVGDVSRAAPVVLAALGDDSVALGAVALAQQAAGQNPFAQKVAPAEYPSVRLARDGIHIGDETFHGDLAIRVDGQVRSRKKLKKPRKKCPYGQAIDLDLVQKSCKGGPSVLFVGADASRDAHLGAGVETWLRHHHTELQMLPIDEAVKAWRASKVRRALLLLPAID